MFNEDASRNRAELEPIDYLTRSTTPRAGLVAIALGVLAIVLAIWLTVGSIDHSLWLTGRLLDAPGAVAEANGDAPREGTRLETKVRLADAQHLALGTRVFVFRNDSAGTFLSGTIHGVQFVERPAEQATAIMRLDIDHDPSSVNPLPSPGEDYRLRIPIGSQRPIEMLLRFASAGRALEP